MVDVNAYINQFFTVLLIIFGLVIVAFSTIIIYILVKYKHKARIRIIAGERELIVEDKARELKKDGVIYWKLLKRKALLNVPPHEAIELNRRGKLCVEMYYDENGDYTYVKRRKEGIEKELLANAKLHAYTTEQRIIHMKELEKAIESKGKTWTEYIPQIASAMVLVIVLLVVVFGWSEIMKPTIKISENQAKISEQQTQMLSYFKDVYEKKQTLEGKEAQVPPS